MQETLNPPTGGEPASNNVIPLSARRGIDYRLLEGVFTQPAHPSNRFSISALRGSEGGLDLSKSASRKSQPISLYARAAIFGVGIAAFSLSALSIALSRPSVENPSQPEPAVTPTPMTAVEVESTPPVQLLDVARQPEDVRRFLDTAGVMQFLREMAQRHPDFSADYYRSDKRLAADKNDIPGFTQPNILQKNGTGFVISPGEHPVIGRVLITRHGVDRTRWIISDSNVFFPSSLLGIDLGIETESGLGQLPVDGILTWPLLPPQANLEALALTKKGNK